MAESSATAISSHGRGVLLQLVAVLLFSSMGAIIKLLGPGYPVSQIIFFRAAPAFLPLLVFLPRLGGWRALQSRRPMLQALRTIGGGSSMILGFWAISRMPFADYVALTFAAPLFATLLAVPLLGETVGPRRTIAVIAGFGGVLLVARPGGEAVGLPYLAALLSAVGYAVAILAVRRLGAIDSIAATVFYYTAACAVGSAFFLPFEWVAPSPRDWALLAAVGLIGGTAQMFMTEAYRLAPASLVAPFDYSAMLWALAFGWLLFDQLPTPVAFAGALVICISGLFIIHRERRLGVPPAKLKRTSL